MKVNPAGYGVLLLCGPLAAIAAVWLADRVGVPYPVLLVALGAILAWLPGVKVPKLAPEVVFYVFLPPLLYYAAYFIAPDDLRANARSIGLLSVGLVIVTMATVAGVLVGVAGLPLAVALVAGAVVAPTDAVAATSVFARLDVPERLVTIVEGEGLTNDGSALVLYTGAVGAVMVGAVRPGPLAVTLLAAPAGGAALGLAVAWLAVKVRRRIDHPLLEITLSLVTPYLTYVIAEGAHLSGVLATVTAGVYVGSHLSAHLRPGGAIAGLCLSRRFGLLTERRAVHPGRHGTLALAALGAGHGRGAGRRGDIGRRCRGDRIAAGVDAVRACHRAAVRARNG